MTKLTSKDFVEAGFKKFSSAHLRRYADYGLQKRFDDERGKKYFIEVYVYDNSEYIARGHVSMSPETWEAELHTTVDDKVFKFQFSGDYETLEAFYADAEKFWTTMSGVHYELWDE